MKTITHELANAYRGVTEPALLFGKALDVNLDEVVDVPVRLPMRMFNRHGLVAGATGTGKTKTLQVMAEGLSNAGVPVLLADLKGDLSGLSAESEGKAMGRVQELNLPWTAESFPVRFLSIDGSVGERLRVPVSEFGPLLMAKIMDASKVQESVLQVVFLIADREGWALSTLSDLQDVLRFLTSDEGKRVVDTYGGMGTSTLNVLLRNTMAMEADGMASFFGQPPFSVASLRATDEGRGVISIVDLTAVQHKPRVFSAFLMWLLSSLYQHSPEVGDADKPELVFFFDEAHMLFEGASKSLVESVRQTVRMIRSKGIGVFFVTQQPTDVPESILSQLGCRVQHALRAFTPKDQRAISASAKTFPVSAAYDVEEALTSLGTGEALVTGLDESGDLTPTAATRLCAPRSAMDPVEVPAAVQAPATHEDYQQAYSAPRAQQEQAPAVVEPNDESSLASKVVGILSLLYLLSVAASHVF